LVRYTLGAFLVDFRESSLESLVRIPRLKPEIDQHVERWDVRSSSLRNLGTNGFQGYGENLLHESTKKGRKGEPDGWAAILRSLGREGEAMES